MQAPCLRDQIVDAAPRPHPTTPAPADRLGAVTGHPWTMPGMDAHHPNDDRNRPGHDKRGDLPQWTVPAESGHCCRDDRWVTSPAQECGTCTPG